MFSKIYISKENLIHNIKYLSSVKGTKLCAMVKANAYGHGAKEIAGVISDYIDFFGVSNENEAFEIRPYTDKGIIVFGLCQNYEKLMEKDVSFAIFSFFDAKNIIKLSKKINKMPRVHICVNTGMNRYGVKTIEEFKKLVELFSKNNIEFEGVYTHFSSLTSDERYTESQYEKFKSFTDYLPIMWHTIKHIGGGNCIYTNMDADMIRIGLQIYGYGNQHVKPVMSIESEIVDLQEVEKGEHVGYLCGYTANKNITVATIPLGYADGFPRSLSNQFQIEINGKQAVNVGNICMDAMMIDVTNITCKVGDKVRIFSDASTLAKQLKTSEYEVLTNLSHLRGEKIVY